MADFLDIEEMLEAPYNKSEQTNYSTTNKSNGKESETIVQKKESIDNTTNRHHSSSDKGKDDKSRRRSRERRHRSRSRSSGSKSRHKSSREKGSSSKDRHSSSRSHRRSRSGSRGRTSRSSHHKSSRHDDEPEKRSRDRDSSSKRRALSPMLSPEERDARTVFVWQLAARIRPRDLEDFFSSVGEVRDVRLILDNKTRKSKGIAYVEFRDVASVPMALALSGSKVLGVPIQIQASQAEKNRAGQPSSILANLASSGLAAVGAGGGGAGGAFVSSSSINSIPSSTNNGLTGTSSLGGPVKLYVGGLHPQINEDMLRGIFEPFGQIDDIQLTRNLITNRSAGNGFVLFRRAEDAQRALDQLNGFELAGKNMKVSTIPEAVRDENTLSPVLTPSGGAPMVSGGDSLIDPATQLALMTSKLVNQGNSQNLMEIASLLATASSMTSAGDYSLDIVGTTMGGGGGSASLSSSNATATTGGGGNVPVDTPCFMLTNMFTAEEAASDAGDIRADVIEECSAHGSILHVFVDIGSSEGNVYVKARSSSVAKACVNAIHGRYFSGRQVTAAYVPLDSYHELFPESVNATEVLEP